jgi:hypothetical protein
MNISTLLQGLASFAWIGVVGVLVLIFVRLGRNQSAKGFTSLVIGLVIAALLCDHRGRRTGVPASQ